MVKQSRQTFLDCGQRSFDYVICKECRLLFTPGVPEDHALHKKHHAAHKRRTLREQKKTQWSEINERCAMRVFQLVGAGFTLYLPK